MKMVDTYFSRVKEKQGFRPAATLVFIFCLLLGCWSCSGGGGGGSSDPGNTAPAAVEGAYEGSDAEGFFMNFLVGGGGKELMNFSLCHGSDVKVDLTAELNEPVIITVNSGQNRYFDQDIYQSSGQWGTVKGLYKETLVRWDCTYSWHVGSTVYSGSIVCPLTLSKESFAWPSPPGTFKEIGVTAGTINLLDLGYSLSFGDFSVDGMDDLFVPCKPSLYQFSSGAENGLGYYFVDTTYDYGTPTDSQLYSLWADLDSDGWLDLLSGGDIYLNGFQATFDFTQDPVWQIPEMDPPYAAVVDINGDNDLDLFTGNWHTNIQAAPEEDDGFLMDYKVAYYKNLKTVMCGFSPIDFDPTHNVPDVDLDLVDWENTVGNTTFKFYRCDRGALPEDMVLFAKAAKQLSLSATAAMVFGDVNNDLKEDLLVIGPNLGSTRLYRNVTDTSVEDPPGGYVIDFDDVTQAVFPDPVRPEGMDVDFADFDNDGWLDFFVTAKLGELTHKLYRNTTGDHGGSPISFEEVTDIADISTIQSSLPGSRCTWCDLDRDGNMDLALGLHRPWLFLNAGGQNNYLTVEPRVVVDFGGGPKKRAAVGAIVLVDLERDGVFDMIRVIRSGRKTHLFAHFGLADYTEVDVRVYFPDGTMKENGAIPIAANQTIVIENT